MPSSRNQVQERLAFNGHVPGQHILVSTPEVERQQFECTVELRLPGLPVIRATGTRTTGKKASEQAAFSQLLEQLREKETEWGMDWDQTVQDAQAGDALIKLAAYLSPDLGAAEDKSGWLQRFESDAHLAETFDALRDAGDADLVMWGPMLSQKRKATLVEAWIWRRYGGQVMAPQADSALSKIMALLAAANGSP